MSNFADVLGNLEGGLAFEKINDQLAELVLAVTQHRKPGEITVSLKVAPNGDTAVSIVAAVKAKIPEGAHGVTVFFADDGGNLLRRDPRQAELPLREVTEPRPDHLRHA